MADINIQSLSARIRQRLNDDEERDIPVNDFRVVSESTSNSLQSSIRKVTGGSTTPSGTGLVKSIVKGIPSAVGGAISDFNESERERRATQPLWGLEGQAVTDLVERPAKILKAVSVDFPRMILGGLSSIGKTALEAVYSPVFGREEVRKSLSNPEAEKLLFAGETKSWQQVKESVDEFTAQSDVATDWEKKNLGLTLAVGGFVADAWVGGGGKSKIASKVLKELVDASDTAVVKTVMTNAKIPAALADDAAEAVAKATTREEVEAALKTSAQRILKQADEAGAAAARTADDVVEGAARAADDIPVAQAADDAAFEIPQKPIRQDFYVNEFDAKGNLRFVPAEKAKAVEISSSVETFISKGREGGWRISEGRTGTLIAEGKTQKEAIEKAGEVIEKNKDNIETAISKAVEKGGVSPRYSETTVPDATSSQAVRQTTRATPEQLAARRTGGEGAPLSNPARTLTTEERAAVQAIDKSLMGAAPTKPANPTPENMSKYWDDRSKFSRYKDAFIEQVQDEMIRMRRLLQGGKLKVTDESNWYDKEIAFHGRIGTRLEDAKERAIQIDADVVKVAKANGVDSDQLTKEVNEYLIARHAPERNAALGDGAAGIKTADAKARIAELEKTPYAAELKRIADDIQKINDETLDILKEGEVITDELFDTLRTKYKTHIPLYRVMEGEDDFAGALGKGFDVKGTGIKTAKGSEREVADVLGNVMFNHEQALIRAEKNRVDLALVQLIRDNPEQLKDLFKIRKPKVVGQTWSGKPITETITDPQILVLREKGKVTLIEIKDPQLAIALHGVGRQKMHGMMRGVAAVTRTYSGLHTRFNPEFAFSNKIRDIQEVLVYAASQEEVGVRGAGKVAAREARLENVRAVLDGIRGKNSEGARLYQQMRQDGGTTGGLGLSTRKQTELDIAEIRKLNRSNPRKAAQKTIELVDQWNTIFEDSSRLSVYRQALEQGASRQRAAVLAKESSVNFNKFGKQGAIINALYIFSNASIQGTTKMLRAMKNPKVAATVTAGVFGSVYAVSEWNDQIDPDWRNKITTWDRLNSLAIMLPSEEGEGVKYVTIPVAWGIKPIKVMADQLVDLQSGNSKGIADATGAVMTSIIEAYNPAGGSDIISAITPTILDIPFEVARNQAWHGGNIKPDWDRNAPPSIQYFASLRDSTTGRMAVGLSKGLSGIGIEISPADIHYSYEQLIGGVGRAANKTVNTMTAFGGGTLPEARNVPFVSRFYKTRPDEEVGAGASEFEQIATVLEEQSRERFYLSQKAEDSLQQLENVPKEEAAAIFEEIKANDPDLAKKIVEIKKEKDKGLTFIDRKILQLGVGNGERAKFLVEKFNSLDTDEERANLWQEYKAKGIISDNVAKQVKALLKEQ